MPLMYWIENGNGKCVKEQKTAYGHQLVFNAQYQTISHPEVGFSWRPNKTIYYLSKLNPTLHSEAYKLTKIERKKHTLFTRLAFLIWDRHTKCGGLYVFCDILTLSYYM